MSNPFKTPEDTEFRFAFPAKLALTAVCFLFFPLAGLQAVNNTAVTVGNASNLSSAATYGGTLPNAGNDVLLSSSTYTSPSAFDVNGTSLIYGTLDDTSTQSLTISNSGASATLSLSNTGTNVSVGASGADLLYVKAGSNLAIQSGVGTLTLNLTVNGNIDNAGVLSLAGPINITAGKTITFTGAGTSTVNGAFANTTGAITINATGGTVALGGSNAFSGATTLTAGTLILANQLALQSSSLAINGGTLVFDSSVAGHAFTFGGLTGTNNLALQDNAGSPNAVTLSVGNNNASTMYSGALSQAGSLFKLGTGTLTLTGANTYSGGTNVSAGILDLQKTQAKSATGTIAVAASGALVLGLSGAGAFTSTDLDNLYANSLANINLNALGGIGVDTANGNVTYASNQASSHTLYKLGANTLILSGTQAITGQAFISGGTLQIGNAGTAGMLSASSSITNNGILSFNRTDNYGGAFTTSIGGTGALALNGTGTFTLSSDNTFTGTTSVNAGTLNLARSLSLQTSTLSVGASGTVTFDASVTSNTFTVAALAGNQNLALQNNASTPAGINLTIGSQTNASTTYSGVLSGLGGLTAFGFSNTIALTGANTYTGMTNVTGATLNLGNGSASGSIQSSSSLSLGGIAGGGTLAYTRTGSVSQTFNGLTINRGGNFLTTSTGTQTLNLGAITSNQGGTVDINPNSTSSISTTTNNTNGILGGFVTFGGKTNWASVNNGIIGAYSGYSISGVGTTNPGATANVDFQASNSTSWNSQSINSLRFNQAAGQTLAIANGSLLEVAAGGILVTPSASSGGTITGGMITGSSGGQLAVNTAGSLLNIASLVVDNGSATAVSLSAPASGRSLTLSNIGNSFSGGLYINGGGVNPTSGGTSLGVGNIYFGNSSVYTGAAGGGIVFGTQTIVMTSGLLVAANGNNLSNGDISGNSGGQWNLIGLPGDIETFAGIIGSYASNRVVNLAVESGTQIIGNTQIGSSQVIANGGTLQLGTGTWGSFSNQNQNVALVVGGGTFVEYGNFAGLTSQAFNNGLTINAGSSNIVINNNSAAGTVVSLAGAITRNIGGTVDFTLPGGMQSISNGVTTVTANTNGILGGYATAGNADWASNNGTNIVVLPAGSYVNDLWAAANNTTVTTSSAPGSSSTTNSLRFNAAGASSLTLTGTNIISSGGILITANVGNNLSSISGGLLEGGASADLIIIQNNTAGGLSIGSVIANNGGATALTKSGLGLLTLTGTNTYTGRLYLNGGIVNGTTANINGSSTTNGISFNGGTLQAALGGISTAKAITLGVNGGTIDTNGSNITLSGAISGTPSGGAGALGGFVASGVFALTKTGLGTLTLSGANSFGGGIIINDGTVQDGAAASGTLGTGYVTFVNNAKSPTLDLSGRSATIAGIIGSGSNGVITNSAASTTSTLTLNGVFGETYAGSLQDGAGIVALTENLANPTQAVTLEGTNTYTGNTTVTAGKLVLKGALNGSTTVSIAASASLHLNNAASITSSGSVIINGILALNGSSTIGSLQMSAGSTLSTTITGSSAGQFGQVSTTNGITLAGGGGVTLTINSAAYTPQFVSGSLSSSDKIALTLGNGTAVSGTFADVVAVADLNYGGAILNEFTDTSGHSWALFYNVNFGAGYDATTGWSAGSDIVLLAIPEPNSASLIFGTLTFFLGLRRRRGVESQS